MGGKGARRKQSIHKGLRVEINTIVAGEAMTRKSCGGAAGK